MNLNYSDSIAASLTTIALEGNAAALQRRLPSGWQLAPFAGDDIRARALAGANILVVFHEIYAVRTPEDHRVGLPQVSYIAFVSPAVSDATRELALIHWRTYTEDPADVPGHYKDGRLADITRQQTFSKETRGETHILETFSAVTDHGEIHLSLDCQQGGAVIWLTADEPNTPFVAANDPETVRWYQEDQVFDVVRSDNLKVDRVSKLSLRVQGELDDVFDGAERIMAVFLRRPYIRQVYVPAIVEAPDAVR